MLIISKGDVNPHDLSKLTQRFYDTIVDSLDFSDFECTCCHHKGFHTFGYYERGVILNDSFKLVVKRIECPNCHKTHALLLQSLVPYSRIPLKTTVEILQLKTLSDMRSYLDSVPCLVEDVILMIRRKYKKYWESILQSHCIPLNPQVSDACLSAFGYQFMQVRFPITISLPIGNTS